MSSRKAWAPEEDAVIARLWPYGANRTPIVTGALLEALPGRTITAITCRRSSVRHAADDGKAGWAGSVELRSFASAVGASAVAVAEEAMWPGSTALSPEKAAEVRVWAEGPGAAVAREWLERAGIVRATPRSPKKLNREHKTVPVG